MQNFITEQADIIIIGAGPAGTACALQLRTMPHLRVILLDKATFPRQKVCGDAIGGHSIKILLKYCPELIEDFRLFHLKPALVKLKFSSISGSHFLFVGSMKLTAASVLILIIFFLKALRNGQKM